MPRPRIQPRPPTCAEGCGGPANHGAFCFNHTRGWVTSREHRLWWDYGPFSDDVYELCVAFYVAKVKRVEPSPEVVEKMLGLGLVELMDRLIKARNWEWKFGPRNGERDE